METAEISILMAAATSYANSMTSLFNMLLTVIFGSLAFSAAISLRNIGQSHNVLGISISSSSIVIALMLLAFYSISFYMFEKSAQQLEVILEELHSQTSYWKFINKEAHASFSSGASSPFGIGYPSIGYLIGSLGALISFVWIANVERPKKGEQKSSCT